VSMLNFRPRYAPLKLRGHCRQSSISELVLPVFRAHDQEHRKIDPIIFDLEEDILFAPLNVNSGKLIITPLLRSDRYTHITQGVWWIKQRSYIEFIELLLVGGIPSTKKEAICKLSIAYAIGILA